MYSFSPYEINTDFTHLHVHTRFSIRDALPNPKKLVDHAKKLGFNALAITDHGNMGGHYQFAVAANSSKTEDGTPVTPIKPIFGIEAYLCNDIHVKEHMIVSDDFGQKKSRRPKHYHIILLAKNTKGYDNLKKMSHISAVDGFYYEPRIDWGVLEAHSEGIICCSACLGGEIASSILNNQKEQTTKDLIDKYKQIFKDDFYLEVQWHQMDDEKKAYSKIMQLADDFQIPIIATNDVHYILEKDSIIHEQVVAMKFKRDEEQGGSSDTRNLSSAYKKPEFYLKSANEMEKAFEDRPDALTNTREIVEKCEFVYPLEHAIIWPECNIPITDKLTEWQKQNFPQLSIKQAFLLQKSMEGLKKLGLSKNKDYVDRLKYEWNIIFDMGYEEYFITQWMIAEECYKRDIMMGPGRGCLAGDSLVLTNNGYKRLDKIKKLDKVYTHTGELKTVLETMEYDIKNEKLLQIQTTNSFNDIKMTKDHNVYGIKRTKTKKFENASKNTKKKYKKYNDIINSPQWYKISDMEKGDLLFTPYPKRKDKIFPDIDLFNFIDSEKVYSISNSEIFLHNPLTNKIATSFNRNIAFDENFTYLLGRWIGDGWIIYNTKKRKYALGIAFNTDDIVSINKITEYLKSLGLIVKTQYDKNKKLLQLMVYNKLIVKLFMHLFPDYKNTSNTKYIGDFKYMNLDLLKSLLNGLIGADGYIESGGNYSRENIDTTSLRLVKDVRESLLYLSIPSYISKRKPWHDNRGYECNQSYKIRFIGINTDRKNTNLVFENGYYVEIKDIKECNENKVYDIAVKDDCSYLTQNYAVHNSGAGSLALYTLGITQIDPLKLGLIFERFLNPGRGVGFNHNLPIMNENTKKEAKTDVVEEISSIPVIAIEI